VTLVTLVTRNRTLEERDYLIMESLWEKEIRELLDSLTRESLDDLIKEIAEAPIFTDPEEVSMTRRTRKRKNTKKTV